MSVLFVVLPLALLLAAAAVAAFAWALGGGQLDDLETPSLRVLVEDGDDAPPAGDAKSGAAPGDGARSPAPQPGTPARREGN